MDASPGDGSPDANLPGGAWPGRPQAHILIHNLNWSYNCHPVLEGISFRIERGDLVALIGPNGAGKSTLLRCLSRVLRPRIGTVLLAGNDVRHLPARQLARQLGVVPQGSTYDFDFTVREVVAMGRYPHLGSFGRPSARDTEAVDTALRLTGTLPLAGRPVSALSGGELQRVTIARALAQEPDILLLDEPTAHLDIAYQVEIMELVRQLNASSEVTVLAAIHDLNLAAQYFPRFLLLAGGRIVAMGEARQTITAELIARAYGIEVTVITHPQTDTPVVLPAGRREPK